MVDERSEYSVGDLCDRVLMVVRRPKKSCMSSGVFCEGAEIVDVVHEQGYVDERARSLDLMRYEQP